MLNHVNKKSSEMPKPEMDLMDSYFHHESFCKNLERHTDIHTIASWPNPKQWQMGHTCDLMMIIRSISGILPIIVSEMGKLNNAALYIACNISKPDFRTSGSRIDLFQWTSFISGLHYQRIRDKMATVRLQFLINFLLGKLFYCDSNITGIFLVFTVIFPSNSPFHTKYFVQPHSTGKCVETTSMEYRSLKY